MTRIKTHKLFPVPIFEFKIQNYENINKKLKEYIYKLQEIDPKGMKLTNRGGWHSRYFKIGENETLKNFVQIIQKYLAEIVNIDFGWECENGKVIIDGMWSIINKKNSYNLRHSHPNCILSAAYYVKAKKNSGKIRFYDPKEVKNMRHPFIKTITDLSAETMNFEPEEGKLLIFPAYLHHAVDENLSDEDRIVISFNVEILK